MEAMQSETSPPTRPVGRRGGRKPSNVSSDGLDVVCAAAAVDVEHRRTEGIRENEQLDLLRCRKCKNATYNRDERLTWALHEFSCDEDKATPSAKLKERQFPWGHAAKNSALSKIARETILELHGRGMADKYILKVFKVRYGDLVTWSDVNKTWQPLDEDESLKKIKEVTRKCGKSKLDVPHWISEVVKSEVAHDQLSLQELASAGVVPGLEYNDLSNATDIEGYRLSLKAMEDQEVQKKLNHDTSGGYILRMNPQLQFWKKHEEMFKKIRDGLGYEGPYIGPEEWVNFVQKGAKRRVVDIYFLFLDKTGQPDHIDFDDFCEEAFGRTSGVLFLSDGTPATRLNDTSRAPSGADMAEIWDAVFDGKVGPWKDAPASLKEHLQKFDKDDPKEMSSNPAVEMFFYHPLLWAEPSTRIHPKNVKAFDMITFPSHIVHCGPPCSSPRKRISLFFVLAEDGETEQGENSNPMKKKNSYQMSKEKFLKSMWDMLRDVPGEDGKKMRKYVYGKLCEACALSHIYGAKETTIDWKGTMNQKQSIQDYCKKALEAYTKYKESITQAREARRASDGLAALFDNLVRSYELRVASHNCENNRDVIMCRKAKNNGDQDSKRGSKKKKRK